jgi:beta-xylosidase
VLTAGFVTVSAYGAGRALQREWPSVVPAPILDVPMRDAAITRGPDGVYYLTGTLQGKGADGALDFDNCRHIKIWTSPDLKAWQPIAAPAKPHRESWKGTGIVFDIKDLDGYDHRKVTWIRQSHKDPSRPDSAVVHGVKAPELHYVKGGWYICFSVNGQGTGLLKSATGKPEGPYLPHAQITLRHGDPSLFWDQKDEFGGDDAVYWLFDGGWIAKMNDDLTALAERPRLLQPQPHTEAAWTRRTRLDFPLQVGDHGVFMFKNRGRYYLTAAERTNRHNASCDDTYVAVADTVYGPYSQRHTMLPSGGGVTVFRGPHSSAVPDYYYPRQRHFLHTPSSGSRPIEEIERAKGDDTFYATFFGNDVRAIFRDRPAFVPLEWTGPERYEHLFYDVESTPRKPRGVFTERGAWPWMKPLIPDEEFRDISVTVAHDGFYYFSGAAIGRPKELLVWQSKDLATWKEIGPLWTYDQIEWLDPKLPYPEGRFPENPKGDNAWEHIFWHTDVTSWNDTFYITYCIFAPKDAKLAHLRGTGALKSTTGRIEGPYESLGRVGGQFGKDPGPNLFRFHKMRDKLYVSDWIHWRDHVGVADLESPGWKGWDWKRVTPNVYTWMQRGDCSAIRIVADTPIFVFHSSGPLDGAEPGSTKYYDVNYIVMETPYGPPREDLNPRCIPHCAAANIFQDREGRWWSSMFGSDPTAPWSCRFGLVALRVEKLENGDLFIDVENNPDEYQKKIMGSGKIAEVKTVVETLVAPKQKRENE